MLTEIMDHFGLARGLRQVGYFETDHHKQLLKELEAAIRESGLVALAGIVGCGKTTLLWQLQDRLKKEGRFAIAESLAVDVDRVNLSTLKLALFHDLATEKDGEPPTKPEKSERALVKLILRHEKPIVLFVDDAHELHGQTLRSLKRIIERVRRRGGQLTIMLAGHPKLKNDLRRPTLEEIGARATVLELDGIKGQQKRFLLWLLAAVRPAESEANRYRHRGGDRPASPVLGHAPASGILSHARPGARLPLRRKDRLSGRRQSDDGPGY
jgi:type II secretory pathway predicted ATPase ExeA